MSLRVRGSRSGPACWIRCCTLEVVSCIREAEKTKGLYIVAESSRRRSMARRGQARLVEDVLDQAPAYSVDAMVGCCYPRFTRPRILRASAGVATLAPMRSMIPTAFSTSWALDAKTPRRR